MQAVLTFTLPEEESELRAAIEGMDHICSIRDFQERLRTLKKYGHSFNSVDDTINYLYSDYCDAMQAWLNQ